MTLVESETGISKGVFMALAIAVILLVTAYFTYTISKPAEKEPAAIKKPSTTALESSLKGSYWACLRLVCIRQMTQDEWTSKYCRSDQGQTWCKVQTENGTNYVVPLQNLNLSVINECGEYACMQEALVRNASYRLLAP